MSDAFAQINALLAAAAAQQQKSSNQQNQQQQPPQPQTQNMTELQKQQQQLLQQFNNNQFNNTNSLNNFNNQNNSGNMNQGISNNQNNNLGGGSSAASALLNQPNGMGQLGGLNEQSLQALLYSQSMQQKSNNNSNNNLNQNQRNLNSNINNQQSFLKDFGQTQSVEDRLRNNEFFQRSNEPPPSNFHNQNMNNQNLNQNQQRQQHIRNEGLPLQTRVLEPYFSDDSPLDSLEHQLSVANMHRENSANQLDILNEFQKISLNDSYNSRTGSNNNNQKMNNNNHNNSHNHNTSSNFDNNNSMFSLNDSSQNIDIYSAADNQNYMPGTASLIEDVDKQIMVVLRDGRTLIGYLRSIDQYANLLLSSTFERIHVGKKYGDIPKGIYIIRGENVVLIGEVDFKLPNKIEMTKVEINEILELQKEEQKAQEDEKIKKKALLEKCQISNTDAVLDEYY